MNDKLEMVDAKWLAGFFDGEGSIGLTHSGVMSPKASIPQSGEIGRIVLTRIVNWLNSQGISCSFETFSTKKLPAYCIRITSRDNVIRFITLVFPYLIVKKVAAQDVLRFLKMYPSLREGDQGRLLSSEGRQHARAARVS